MDNQNNFFAPSEQYAWTNPTSFEQSYQHGNLAFPVPSSGPPPAANGFTMPAPVVASHYVFGTGAPQAARPGAPRTRQNPIPWDLHQDELKKLYLVDKMKLEDIRDKMRREKSLEATERAEVTVKRAGKDSSEIINMTTPMGVVYETPAQIDLTSPETALTPYEGNTNVDEVMTISSGSDSDAWESDVEINDTSLSLTWNGNTRSDVHNMFLSARQHIRSGNTEQAETLLKLAVQGYGHLHGPTHEETNIVVVTLATLCFESDRLTDAYKVIEQSCRVHIEKAGIHDRRTQQHINDIIQLLHSWNKEDDALAFIARAKEIADKSRDGFAKRDKSRREKSRSVTNHSQRPRETLLHEASRAITEDSDSTQLDYGLSLVRTHAHTEGETTQQLLRLTIERCGLDTNKLAIQRLKAWAELLKLCNKAGRAHERSTDFENAHSAFIDVMQQFSWDETTREKFKRFRLMETALELVATFLSADRTMQARDMFQTCEETASRVFGEYDERTVWVLISIGLVYQRYKGWNEASPWFQHALSTAMELYDENDGIRISLEEALEVRHFSYVNDEGRPFKTIFGVNGLKITPTRLHMG
ncbi:hypothetical protein P153DRAFT_360258 [Dothidotthia symphoricarpi CBS 119687]|uniref:Clr5 domain-containing protein n=1 Tax=Dothidotthia symphoricarpi CBS 119687 TaxID=1392245 RepID=A0A6A5ZZS5_9PLEO|nr:uncharacterized protein P153DRAFT_360258 [Dothidotthia symphoricarpi CBS 119687]KAF2125252.1 hypothetical protein P153DRAFT_360258 [Dothidotthia symphoricarpi CBS 119687]